MIYALIRKDLRLCRLPLVVMLCMLMACLAIAWALMSTTALRDTGLASAVGFVLVVGTRFAGIVATGVLAVLSGMIFATERADRSAEFLAYLPPSKAMVLLSKFLVVAGCLLIVWAGPPSVATVAEWIGGSTDTATEVLKGQPNSSQYMPLAIMFMGIGWCSSAFLSSTGPPVALSFMSPLALGGALACSQTLVGWPAQNVYAEVYSALCAVLGCIAFLTGTIYFLNRVEP